MTPLEQWPWLGWPVIISCGLMMAYMLVLPFWIYRPRKPK